MKVKDMANSDSVNSVMLAALAQGLDYPPLDLGLAQSVHLASWHRT